MRRRLWAMLRGAARLLDLTGRGVPRRDYSPEAVIKRAMQ